MAVPVNDVFGVKTRPASASFTSVTVPVNVIEASAVPSPTVKPRSPISPGSRLRVPLVTDRLISISPTSGSATETVSPAIKLKSTFSVVVTAGGVVTPGFVLTAVTVMSTLSFVIC